MNCHDLALIKSWISIHGIAEVLGTISAACSALSLDIAAQDANQAKTLMHISSRLDRLAADHEPSQEDLPLGYNHRPSSNDDED